MACAVCCSRDCAVLRWILEPAPIGTESCSTSASRRVGIRDLYGSVPHLVCSHLQSHTLTSDAFRECGGLRSNPLIHISSRIYSPRNWHCPGVSVCGGRLVTHSRRFTPGPFGFPQGRGASTLGGSKVLPRDLLSDLRLRHRNGQVHFGQQLRFFRIARAQVRPHLAHEAGRGGGIGIALRLCGRSDVLTVRQRNVFECPKSAREHREGRYDRQGRHQISAFHTASSYLLRRESHSIVRIFLSNDRRCSSPVKYTSSAITGFPQVLAAAMFAVAGSAARCSGASGIRISCPPADKLAQQENHCCCTAPQNCGQVWICGL